MSNVSRTVSICLLLLLGVGDAAAQPLPASESAPLAASHLGPGGVLDAQRTLPVSSLVPSSLPPRRFSSVPPSLPSSSSSFGQALLGSSLGLAVGGPLGVLLVRTSMDDSAWETAEEHRDDCCSLERLGVGLLGVGVAAGSGPYGAARRLGEGGVPVYGASVTGEVLFGALGYGLGSGLGRSDRQKRILGLALGFPLAAVGAALGAVLAPPTDSSAHAALNVHQGRWSVGVPQVRLQPHATVDRPPVVHVSLFSAEL